MNTTEPTKSFWERLQEFGQTVRQKVAESQSINSKLDEIGLSNELIASQNSAQLLKMLETIDELLDKGLTPQQFGNAEFSLFKTITLSRRRLVINRLSLLAQEKKINALEGLAQKLPESDSRAEFEKLFQEMRKELQRYEVQQKETEDQLAKDSKGDNRLHILQRRDLVANAVGILLVVTLFCVLVIASVKKIAMPEIIGNSLSLVLGYFFARVKE